MKITKISEGCAIDHAAEEFKKYYNMMTLCKEATEIVFDKKGTDGFCIGLMTDFGLDVSDADDIKYDDILYINTSKTGGIIAGSNPRSVLLAVYEFFRQNGCRWLMPGRDGEYIPVKDIVPVKYRHKPTLRNRGWGNEGSYYQQSILDLIEFTPKVGMNTVYIQFPIPKVFYDRYYRHINNQENEISEEVTTEQVRQWTCQCAHEITKRGLCYVTGGHGWVGEAFDISSENAWSGMGMKPVDEKYLPYLAMLDGKRGIKNSAAHTNFCLSNPETRKIIVDYFVGYLQRHPEVDKFAPAIGDSLNTQCECEECTKKTPADWCVVLLNELDAELTRLKIDVKLHIAAYADTVWAPKTEKFNNPDRFVLVCAPITRNYTMTLPEEPRDIKVSEFKYNKNTRPLFLDEYFAYFNDWKKVLNRDLQLTEYYFWIIQYLDPSGMVLTERIKEDIRVYREFGMTAMESFISPRSFFPNGYLVYVWARIMYDDSLTTEELKQEYFSCAYGKYSDDVTKFFEEVSDVVDFRYMMGAKGTAEKPYFCIEEAEKLSKAVELATKGRLLCKKIEPQSRVQTVSAKLLYYFCIYLEHMGEYLKLKALGKDIGAEAQAKLEFDKFRVNTGKFECNIKEFYDHFLAFKTFYQIENNVNRVLF